MWLYANAVSYSAPVPMEISLGEPTLTGFAPTIDFGENTVNATPQFLDNAVDFIDSESDFNGGTLTVSGLLAEDQVGIMNAG